MSSTRCDYCAGTGQTPTDYAYGSCQFCGGRGWVLDLTPRTTTAAITSQE
jgi:hypothetical protein